MPCGSGGLESQENSVTHSCFFFLGATVPSLSATESGRLIRFQSAMTTSSGLGAWRRGGPIGYGWCASTSKRTGESEHLKGLRALRPRRQNSSRQKSAGGMRLPPGASPNGEVPAVTTTFELDTDLRPRYQPLSSAR